MAETKKQATITNELDKQCVILDKKAVVCDKKCVILDKLSVLLDKQYALYEMKCNEKYNETISYFCETGDVKNILRNYGFSVEIQTETTQDKNWMSKIEDDDEDTQSVILDKQMVLLDKQMVLLDKQMVLLDKEAVIYDKLSVVLNKLKRIEDLNRNK
eukprot:429469_1